jgi:hypothetical protein
MPVKIVDNDQGSTATLHGTIRENDLFKMKSDFKKEVGLTALPPRFGVIKKHCFYFSIEQLRELLKHYKDNEQANALEIAIGVQLRETIINCEGETQFNESDSLAAIISMANRPTLEPFNEIGDYVMINGYKDIEVQLIPTACCPGSKPPPYNI